MKPYKNDLDKYLRWYVKQPECERIAIHNEQVIIFRRLLAEKRKAGEVAKVDGDTNYLAFCESVSRRYRLHNEKLDNRQNLKAIEAIRINVAKNTRKIKSSKVRDKISSELYLTIKTLRNEGLSWVKIKKYIAQHHKRRISTAYLHRIFTEMEKERELDQIESESVDKNKPDKVGW